MGYEIDDFEDQDLSEYSDPGGQENTWSFSTDAVSGSYSLQGGRTSSYRILSTSGLPNYFAPGDSMRFRVKLRDPDSPDSPSFLFGVPSETATDTDGEYYRFNLNTANNEIQLKDNVDASPSVVTAVTPPTGEWLRVRIDWDVDGSGDITATLSDASGSELAAVTMNDTAYRDSGIGWTGGGGTETSETPRYDAAVRLPYAPSGLTAQRQTQDAIELAWSNTDAYDEVEVLRATASGSTLGDYSGIATLSSAPESYTDDGLLDGERYFYRVRGVLNGSDSDLSGEADSVTLLPAPSGLESPSHSDTSIDVEWTSGHDYGDTRVEYRPTDVSGWTTHSTVSRTAESETITGLRTGEEYEVRVVASTEHADSVDYTLEVASGETFTVDSGETYDAGGSFDVAGTVDKTGTIDITEDT